VSDFLFFLTFLELCYIISYINGKIGYRKKYTIDYKEQQSNSVFGGAKIPINIDKGDYKTLDTKKLGKIKQGSEENIREKKNRSQSLVCLAAGFRLLGNLCLQHIKYVVKIL